MLTVRPIFGVFAPRFRRVSACAAVALLSPIGCASASALNLTGAWSANYHCETGPCPGGPGSNFPATDTLTQSGEAVTGTNSTGETITGTLIGETFAFQSSTGSGYEAKATLTVASDGLSWSGPAEDTNGTKGTYTALRDPTVTGVEPAEGPEAGGTEVTIHGAGFRAGATVEFGPSPASNVNVTSAESITATAPAGSGVADVVVTTTVGTSPINSADEYAYGRLGGLNIESYCASLGDNGKNGKGEGPAVLVKGGIEGPEYAYNNWACVQEDGTEVLIADKGSAPSMDNACAVAFPSVPSHARAENPDNAYTWNCYEGAPEAGKGGEGHNGGETTAKTSSLVTPIVSMPPLVVPPPVLARTGNVAPVSGTVLVKLPGTNTFVPLSSLRQIPFGSVIDATNGTVSVTTALPHGGTQTGQFFSGEFILRQGPNGLVVAELTGGNFSVCPTKRERLHVARVGSVQAYTAASGKHVVRKLWANAHGKFSTKGNYAAGAVQGTEWLTEDLCDGTLIRVTRDKVAVTNLVNHKHVVVKVGHKYLAKAP